MDVLDEQEFHELCMDYRGAVMSAKDNAPQLAFRALQEFIRREYRREALEEAAKVCDGEANGHQVTEEQRWFARCCAKAIRALIEPSSPP